jgi:hypothetical protein
MGSSGSDFEPPFGGALIRQTLEATFQPSTVYVFSIGRHLRSRSPGWGETVYLVRCGRLARAPLADQLDPPPSVQPRPIAKPWP